MGGTTVTILHPTVPIGKRLCGFLRVRCDSGCSAPGRERRPGSACRRRVPGPESPFGQSAGL